MQQTTRNSDYFITPDGNLKKLQTSVHGITMEKVEGFTLSTEYIPIPFFSFVKR